MKIVNKRPEETVYIYVSSCDSIVIKYLSLYSDYAQIIIEFDDVEPFLEKFNAAAEKLKKKIEIGNECSTDE